MTENHSAREGSTVSSAFAQNINALHSACQAYIQAESSNNIRKVLQSEI